MITGEDAAQIAGIPASDVRTSVYSISELPFLTPA
jgi:hypothetical protein